MMNSGQYRSPLFKAVWFSMLVSFMFTILLLNVAKVPAHVRNEMPSAVDSGSESEPQEIKMKSPTPPLTGMDIPQSHNSRNLRSLKEKHSTDATAATMDATAPKEEKSPRPSHRTKVSTVVMKSVQQIVRGLKGMFGVAVLDETSPKDAAEVELFDTVPAWEPIGSEIFVADTGKCKSVSLSRKGFTVATGVPGLNSFVNVYQLIGDDWAPKGSAISVYLPPGYPDCSGGFVSLSDDGDVVAIGAPANDGGGSPDGAVRVLEWDGIDWAQKGEDILGEFGDGIIGNSISLSGDGQTVAIGNAVVNANSNILQVFEWDGTAWTQKGENLGETMGIIYNYMYTYFYGTTGWDVSMSGDGNTVAFGDPRSKEDSEKLYYTCGWYDCEYMYGWEGRYVLLDWDGTEWVERVEKEGGKLADLLGSAVALSYDGQTVAAGAPSGKDGRNNYSGYYYQPLNRDSGSIRVSKSDYSGNWDSSPWIQGMDYFNTREFGTVLALSGDGNTVAGCVQSERGQIIFGIEAQSEQWKPKGLPIDTTCASIYLNHYGNIVAISDGGNGVQVYSLGELATAAESAHPYEPKTKQKWNIDLAADYNGCAVLTMDPLSYTSSNKDAFLKLKLEIFDDGGSFSFVGGTKKLHGTTLSEFPQTTVYGDRLKIRFKSKSRAEPNYGFKLFIQHCYNSS